MPNLPPLSTDFPRRLSLVTQTIEWLRARMRAGGWEKRLPAERELCALLQISRPTLRAALLELEKSGEIVARQRSRVIAAPSAMATALHDGASRTVHVLAPAPLQAMSATTLVLYETSREALTRAGCQVELHVDRRCFSDNPARALEKRVQETPASAWMALGSREPMQRWFLERHLPLLVIGSCRPGIDLASIDKDYRAVSRHAGDLLWRRGHRRLALVIPKETFDGDLDSEQGFRESLQSHAQAGAELKVLRHNGTLEHLCALLDKTLAEAKPPTAYFIIRPTDALTVTTHLLRRRLRVPGDVSVLARDDEHYLRHTSPEVSRYSLNSQQFARHVSLAACELAETGRLAPRALRFLPKLVPGGTL